MTRPKEKNGGSEGVWGLEDGGVPGTAVDAYEVHGADPCLLYSAWWLQVLDMDTVAMHASVMNNRRAKTSRRGAPGPRLAHMAARPPDICEETAQSGLFEDFQIYEGPTNPFVSPPGAGEAGGGGGQRELCSGPV